MCCVVLCCVAMLVCVDDVVVVVVVWVVMMMVHVDVVGCYGMPTEGSHSFRKCRIQNRSDRVTTELLNSRISLLNARVLRYLYDISTEDSL